MTEPASNTQSYVDQVIESGRHLKELRPFFPSWEKALKYYADRATKEHSQKKDDGKCIGCGAGEAETHIGFTWSAVYYKARWLVVSFLISAVLVPFGFGIEKSGHVLFVSGGRVCKSCLRGIRSRQVVSGLITTLVCFPLLLVSLGGLVISLVVLVASPFIGEAGRMSMVSAAGVAASGLVAYVVCFAYRSLPVWIVPKPCRSVHRWPFRMTQTQVFHKDADEGITDAPALHQFFDIEIHVPLDKGDGQNEYSRQSFSFDPLSDISARQVDWLSALSTGELRSEIKAMRRYHMRAYNVRHPGGLFAAKISGFMMLGAIIWFAFMLTTGRELDPDSWVFIIVVGGTFGSLALNSRYWNGIMLLSSAISKAAAHLKRIRKHRVP